ncbi:MAG: hypothetical protein ACOYBJ_00185 [Patescibacteria group bacterium]
MTITTLDKRFDLAPMRDWLEREKAELMRKVARFQQFAKGPQGAEHVQLSGAEELAGQFELDRYWQALAAFPEPAQRRILPVLHAVQGGRTVYLHRDSKNAQIGLTIYPDQTLGLTHIIPGSFFWAPSTGYTVALNRLPEEFASQEVTKLILLHALVHDFAHVLIGASWSQERFEPAIIDFARLMAEQKLSPISYYSSNYWSDPAELMPLQKNDGVYGPMPAALDEELAEVITAWILKFCFCEPYVVLTNGGRQRIELRGRGSLGFRPFADRPAIEEWATNFLYAE